MSRAISGQRSIPLIFLSVSWSSAFRLDPLRNDPRQPGEGARRWYGSHRLSRPSAMHELFLVSYLGGAISTARKPPTLYRAINRRETERKRGGWCARDTTTFPCPLLAISCTTSKDRSLRNDPAAKPGDPPGRNEGGLRLDWLGDVGRIVLVFSLVGYLSVASFFLSKIITDFCNAFRKSVLTTNPRGANSFNYIRSLIVPSYREQTSVRKTIR